MCPIKYVNYYRASLLFYLLNQLCKPYEFGWDICFSFLIDLLSYTSRHLPQGPSTSLGSGGVDWKLIMQKGSVWILILRVATVWYRWGPTVRVRDAGWAAVVETAVEYSRLSLAWWHCSKAPTSYMWLLAVHFGKISEPSRHSRVETI